MSTHLCYGCSVSTFAQESTCIILQNLEIMAIKTNEDWRYLRCTVLLPRLFYCFINHFYISYEKRTWAMYLMTKELHWY